MIQAHLAKWFDVSEITTETVVFQSIFMRQHGTVQMRLHCKGRVEWEGGRERGGEGEGEKGGGRGSGEGVGEGERWEVGGERGRVG